MEENKSLYSKVENIVIKEIHRLAKEMGVDSDTCDFLFKKYSALGASLVDCAYMYSSTPSLPKYMTIKIIDAINEERFKKDIFNVSK